MISEDQIMLGNWFIGYDNKPFEWEMQHWGILWDAMINSEEIIKEPIKLTSEILEKCGATGTNNSWQLQLSFGAVDLYFRFHSGIPYSELGGIYLGDKIKYLHQLQNLFTSLLNRPLKIKL